MTSRVMVLGVGAFAHAVQTILQENGAETTCYLTRPYSHFGPKIAGQTWNAEDHPSPLSLIEKFKPDLIIPHAVAWAEQPWAADLVSADGQFLVLSVMLCASKSHDRSLQICAGNTASQSQPSTMYRIELRLVN